MSTWQRLWNNSAVKFGVIVLGLLIVLAAVAPWLGTVDPAAMDSANINTAVGTHGSFALLDGSSIAHTFWFGADSFGRDIYSRVIYGTRVSLLIGITTAVVAIGIGAVLGMLAGYFRGPLETLTIGGVGSWPSPPSFWPSHWSPRLARSYGQWWWRLLCRRFRVSRVWCAPWC